MERRQDSSAGLPDEAPQTVGEGEKDRESGREAHSWGGRVRGRHYRESERICPAQRHIWQLQGEMQAAKISNNDQAMQACQTEYRKLRSQALWAAASPGCLAWLWRWASLPRSL